MKIIIHNTTYNMKSTTQNVRWESKTWNFRKFEPNIYTNRKRENEQTHSKETRNNKEKGIQAEY